MTEKAEEIAQPIEIEPGVTRTPAVAATHWHGSASDMITFHTQQMTPERVAYYGLTRYAEMTAARKAVKDGETKTKRTRRNAH